MSKLTQNFDLIAIAVLALVLGVAQAPKMHFRSVVLEHSGPEFRIVHVDPVVRALRFAR